MKNTHENIFALQIMFLIQLVWQIVMLIDGVKYDLFPNWLTAVDLSIGIGLFISGIIVAIVKKAHWRGWLFALLPAGSLAMVSVLLALKLMYYN